MTSDPVLIQVFEIRAQAEGRTLYRLTAGGEKYATTNAWLASLCKTAHEKGRRVVLSSSSGWYYRDLVDVRLVEENEPVIP